MSLPSPLTVAKAVVTAFKNVFFAVATLILFVPLFQAMIFAGSIALVLYGHRLLGLAFMAFDLIVYYLGKNLRI